MFIVSAQKDNKGKLIQAISDPLELVQVYHESRLSQHVYAHTLKITTLDTIMPIGIVQDTINELLAIADMPIEDIVDEVVNRCACPAFEVYTGEDGRGEILLLQWEDSAGYTCKQAFNDNTALLYDNAKQLIKTNAFTKVR
jgi:hypothetical protein